MINTIRMIYYEDNFLPEEQFTALKNRVANRFVPTGKKKFSENSDDPARLTYHGSSGDWREACNLLGHECVPAIEKIILTLESFGIKELKNWSVWYQYIINTMSVPPHADQGLRKSDQKNTYSAILYTSDWEPGWGGEFIVGDPTYPPEEENINPQLRTISLTNISHVIEPLPNRLLVWRRDMWHAVNKVTNNDPGYVRSFLGTGWSSIDVLPFHQFDTG